MDLLEKELKLLLKKMQKNTDNKYEINEEMLDNVYSVYPFNKFEYI